MSGRWRSLGAVLCGALLALSLGACGDDGPSQGTVMGSVDLEGVEEGTENAAGVTLSFGEGEDAPTTTTAPDSTFERKLSPGSYQVTASFEGYTTATKSVEVTGGQTTELFFRLQEKKAPVITSFNVAPSRVEAGGEATAKVSATDANGDELNYTWSTSNGFTISQSGDNPAQATITAPDESQVTGDVTVTVTEANTDRQRSTTRSMTIRTTDRNKPPSITNVSTNVPDGEGTARNLMPGAAVGVEVSASDPEENTLNWSWDVPGDWTKTQDSCSSFCEIVAPDSYDSSGTITINVEEANNEDNSDSAKITLGTKQSEAPVIERIGLPNDSGDNLTVSPENPNASVTVVASDPDTPSSELTYEWTTSNSDWTITDSSSKTTEVEGPNRYDSQATFRVTVTDDADNTATARTTISTFGNTAPRIGDIVVGKQTPDTGDNTEDVNRSPRGGTVGVTAIPHEDLQSGDIEGASRWDPNGDEVEFEWSVSNQSAGWSVEGSGASATISTPETPNASTTVDLTIREVNTDDQRTAEGSAIVTTRRNAKPAFVDGTPEVLTENPTDANSEAKLYAKAENQCPNNDCSGDDDLAPDDDELSYTWTSLDPNNFPIQGNSDQQTITVEAPADPELTGRFRVEVTDGYDSETAVVTLTVEGNDPVAQTASPPRKSELTSTRDKLDRGASVDISSTWRDKDDHTLSYRWRFDNNQTALDNGWSLSNESDGNVTVNAPDAPGESATALLVVEDDYEGQATARWSFETVANKEPECTVTPESGNTNDFFRAKVSEGGTIDLDIQCNDPEGDDIEYKWTTKVINDPVGPNQWSYANPPASGSSVTVNAPSEVQTSPNKQTLTVKVKDEHEDSFDTIEAKDLFQNGGSSTWYLSAVKDTIQGPKQIFKGTSGNSYTFYPGRSNETIAIDPDPTNGSAEFDPFDTGYYNPSSDYPQDDIEITGLEQGPFAPIYDDTQDEFSASSSSPPAIWDWNGFTGEESDVNDQKAVEINWNPVPNDHGAELENSVYGSSGTVAFQVEDNQGDTMASKAMGSATISSDYRFDSHDVKPSVVSGSSPAGVALNPPDEAVVTDGGSLQGIPMALGSSSDNWSGTNAANLEGSSSGCGAVTLGDFGAAAACDSGDFYVVNMPNPGTFGTTSVDPSTSTDFSGFSNAITDIDTADLDGNQEDVIVQAGSNVHVFLLENGDLEHHEGMSVNEYDALKYESDSGALVGSRVDGNGDSVIESGETATQVETRRVSFSSQGSCSSPVCTDSLEVTHPEEDNFTAEVFYHQEIELTVNTTPTTSGAGACDNSDDGEEYEEYEVEFTVDGSTESASVIIRDGSDSSVGYLDCDDDPTETDVANELEDVIDDSDWDGTGSNTDFDDLLSSTGTSGNSNVVFVSLPTDISSGLNYPGAFESNDVNDHFGTAQLDGPDPADKETRAIELADELDDEYGSGSDPINNLAIASEIPDADDTRDGSTTGDEIGKLSGSGTWYFEITAPTDSSSFTSDNADAVYFGFGYPGSRVGSGNTSLEQEGYFNRPASFGGTKVAGSGATNTDIVIGSIDKSGGNDVVLVDDAGNFAVSLQNSSSGSFLGPSTRTLSNTPSIDPTVQTPNMDVGDVNNDGQRDVVFSYGNPATIAFGNNLGSFHNLLGVTAEENPDGVGELNGYLALNAFDGDGDGDDITWWSTDMQEFVETE